MRRSTWATAITGAATLGTAAALVVAAPAQAATTATASVTSYAIKYEAGVGQANSVQVHKIVNSLGTFWQFTDVVPITAGPGCYHPYRGAAEVWCGGGSSLVAVYTLDQSDYVGVYAPNTIVFAGGGNDSVSTLWSSSQWTIVYGEDGSDMIHSGAAKDSIDGGSGQDTVAYGSRTVGISASLQSNTGGPTSLWGLPAAEDTFISIENLIGGAAGDLLAGDSGANKLEGGYGNDSLLGGDGPDVLEGEEGNDALWGDGGDDMLFGGLGSDVLNGDDGVDEFDGGGGSGYDQCNTQVGELYYSCEYVSQA